MLDQAMAAIGMLESENKKLREQIKYPDRGPPKKWARKIAGGLLPFLHPKHLRFAPQRVGRPSTEDTKEQLRAELNKDTGPRYGKVQRVADRIMESPSLAKDLAPNGRERLVNALRRAKRI